MDEQTDVQLERGSMIWIQNLVDGIAGITIRARHADFCGASPFQKVEVFDTYAFGRVLMLGGAIVLTEKDEHIYHEMIVHPALLTHARPESVCIIGGGDGGCLREVLKHTSVEAVTVVDIDELVKKTIETYFPQLSRGFGDSRTSTVIDDGFSFLEKRDSKYDVIIVDSYDPGGPVQSLETEGFHGLVRSRLNHGGIAVYQADSPTLRGETIRAVLDNVEGLYDTRRPFLCTIPSFPGGICSFVMCLTAADEDHFDNKRYGVISPSCRYYNEEMHSGAFRLPRHIRSIVDS